MNKSDIINTYIESQEMRDYLLNNISELSDRQLADIICGGRKPLSKKCEDLKRLAEFSNDVYISEAYSEAAEAIADLILNYGEVFLVTEKGYASDISLERIYGSAPAISLNQVSATVKKDLDDCTEEENKSRTDWYELEKYVSDCSDNLEWKSVYTIAPNNEIWFYHNVQANPLRHHLNSGSDLYLPIPFEIGDILTIDCRPFRPVKHAVLIEKGSSCCSVTCAWISNEGYIRTGSLMHNNLFDDNTVPISALYRLEKFEKRPCVDERALKDISESIKGKVQKGEKLWDFIVHNEDLDYQKIMEWIEEHRND